MVLDLERTKGISPDILRRKIAPTAGGGGYAGLAEAATVAVTPGASQPSGSVVFSIRLGSVQSRGRPDATHGADWGKFPQTGQFRATDHY